MTVAGGKIQLLSNHGGSRIPSKMGISISRKKHINVFAGVVQMIFPRVFKDHSIIVNDLSPQKIGSLDRTFVKFPSPGPSKAQRSTLGWSLRDYQNHHNLHVLFAFCRYYLYIQTIGGPKHATFTTFLKKTWKESILNPVCSMYGIFTYIYHKFKPHVGKYSMLLPIWECY